jgi:hypothetical protein
VKRYGVHLHRTKHLIGFPTARFLRNSRDWKAKASSPSLLMRGAETNAREKVRSRVGLLGLVRMRVSPLRTDLTLAMKFLAILGSGLEHSKELETGEYLSMI